MSDQIEEDCGKLKTAPTCMVNDLRMKHLTGSYYPFVLNSTIQVKQLQNNLLHFILIKETLASWCF